MYVEPSDKNFTRWTVDRLFYRVWYRDTGWYQRVRTGDATFSVTFHVKLERSLARAHQFGRVQVPPRPTDQRCQVFRYRSRTASNYRNHVSVPGPIDTVPQADTTRRKVRYLGPWRNGATSIRFQISSTGSHRQPVSLLSLAQ